jgi:hypothetical protein
MSPPQASDRAPLYIDLAKHFPFHHLLWFAATLHKHGDKILRYKKAFSIEFSATY